MAVCPPARRFRMSERVDLHQPSEVDQALKASRRGDSDRTAAVPPGGMPAGPAFGPPAEPGDVGSLGPYRIVKQLGRGAMGAVYEAIDRRLNRRLAVKVMLPQFAADVTAKGRFLREA